MKFRTAIIKNLSIISMIVALLIPILFYTVISKKEGPYDLLYNKIELLSLRIGLQENFISETSALIEDISKSGDANVDNAIQVNQISQKVEQLELNYKELQDVIIGNPSNIIEFALLLKEVDTLKEGVCRT